MTYETLHDPVAADEDAFSASPVVVKFCNMGFVSSKKWTSAYVTIVDGVVRLYDSKESCLSDPQSSILKIVLTRHHMASEVKRKNYSPDKSHVLELFQFYIEIDNGIFAATRLIKIASPEPVIIEKMVKCIDLHTSG